MKTLFALALLFLFVSCNSDSDVSIETSAKLEELNHYPQYRTVARHLMENYKQNPNSRFSFELAKKPEGWVLMITDWKSENSANISEIIFWSKESKEFAKLDSEYFLKRQEKLSEEEFEYFMRQNYSREFYSKILPYSGYINHYKDIINLLENYDSMNDTLYHAMGVGYFGMTQYYLGYKTDFSYNYNDTYNPDDFDKYIECAEKCVDAYKKGVELNTKFKSFIGQLRTKMSNDIIGIWYEMELRGYGDRAKHLLKNVNYPQSLIDFALNTLNSCDSNAILFTHGDNDTYPLWYVQSKMNVRPDVSVVNISLLGAPFYSAKWKGLYSIPITLSEKLVNSELSSIVVINTSSTGSQDIGEVFDSMKDEKLGNKLDKKIANAGDYLSYSSKWTMALDGKFLKELENITLQDNILVKEIVFNFQKSYIYRSDLLILNIIYGNQWKRPIYFAQGFATSSYSYLEDYLVQEGLVLSMHPYILYENSNDPCSDTLKLRENLLHKYSYSKLSGADVEERIVNGIMNVYYQAILEFKYKNQEIAVQLLDKAFKEFPGELVENKFMHINMALLYKDFGQEEKARGIISKLIKQIKVIKADKDEMDRFIRLVEQLILYGFKNEADELSSKL